MRSTYRVREDISSTACISIAEGEYRRVATLGRDVKSVSAALFSFSLDFIKFAEGIYFFVVMCYNGLAKQNLIATFLCRGCILFR